MMCSQFRFGTVSISVVVYVYLTTSAQCVYGFHTPWTDSYINQSCHRLKIGIRRFGDQVFVKETIKEDVTTGSSNFTKYYRYPPQNASRDYYLVTCIDINDKGNGGFVELKDGGPGSEFVSFTLSTCPNIKFEFQVSIYGYY